MNENVASAGYGRWVGAGSGGHRSVCGPLYMFGDAPIRLLGRLGRVIILAVLLSAVWGCASAWASWTTYRGDAARSGVDSSGSGSVPFASAWTSASLDGTVYGEPLVYGGSVFVATEAGGVYALAE